MKKLMIALSAFLVSATLFAQSATDKAENLVKFKELSYDFGKIKQNVPVTHDFVFSNISNGPVIIENANASCGCTTPKWPAPPVAKGKSDKISAGFNAQTLGTFTKSIYVKVAGIDAPVEIKITGEVLTNEDYAKYEKGKAKPSKSGGQK